MRTHHALAVLKTCPKVSFKGQPVLHAHTAAYKGPNRTVLGDCFGANGLGPPARRNGRQTPSQSAMSASPVYTTSGPRRRRGALLLTALPWSNHQTLPDPGTTIPPIIFGQLVDDTHEASKRCSSYPMYGAHTPDIKHSGAVVANIRSSIQHK